MNASQRARRRERRRSAREQTRREALAPALDFDRIFSFSSLMRSSKICRRGVMWKGSVQSFVLTGVLSVARLHRELAEGIYRKSPPIRFTLNERGTTREISGVCFRDRVVQRTLCDNSMIPVLCRGIISDNSASLEGRGMSFAEDRFIRHMSEAFRRWGEDAAVVQIDIKSFFGSIDSRACYEGERQEYMRASSPENAHDAERICAVVEENVTEEDGVGLGNQTSQTSAIWYPSRVDHFVREVLRCGLSGRYMDDAYIFCESVERAEEVLEAVRAEFAKIGLRLHPRKTKIRKITEPITFLKNVHRIDSNGMVRTSMAPKSISHTVSHIKSVYGLVERGEVDEQGYLQTVSSCYGNVVKRGSAKQRRRFEAAIPEQYHWKLREIRIRQCNVPKAKRKIR